MFNVGNVEEKKISYMQKVLDELNEVDSHLLDKLNTPYDATLKRIGTGITYKNGYSTLNFEYEVMENSILKKVVDSFVFNEDNSKFYKFNLRRLKETLKLYGEDFKVGTDIETLSEIYQNLVGTKVVLEQSIYKNFPKCTVISTERIDNI